jgi:NAD-dependent DNA ligase
LTKIGTKSVGLKTLEKIYSHRGSLSLSDVVSLKGSSLTGVEGFGQKTRDNIEAGIKKALSTVDFTTFGVATGLLGMGVGERKIRPVMDKYQSTLLAGTAPTLSLLKSVDGLGDTYAPMITENWSEFWDFWIGLPDSIRETIVANSGQGGQRSVQGASSGSDKEPESVTEPKFRGHRILLTGFRDADLSRLIAGYEAKTMSGQVTMLIIKNSSADNKKIQKARETGITVLTKDEFYANWV